MISPQNSASNGIAALIGNSPLEQPPLPFADSALEPVISARTLGFHYGKHHKGYFDKLKPLVADTPLAGKSLEEIIVATSGDASAKGIFNNAAQCWNHNFYWLSLSPLAQKPSGKLAEAIDRDFGSLDACLKALSDVAVAHFGSGWGWLVVDGGKLKAVSTSDAVVPFTSGQFPLLTVYVWEHAYYLDYQNRRPDHVKAVVEGHMNWEFAATNFAKAKSN
jgi:Fe-Mn family superoxide dismutase